MVHGGEFRALATAPPESTAHLTTPLQRTARQLSSSQVDELVEDYRAGAGSIYVLAAKYKVHRNTIAARLKERGLTLGKRPMDADEIKRAQELHGQGLSLNAIGAAIGRDPKTVKAALS